MFNEGMMPYIFVLDKTTKNIIEKQPATLLILYSVLSTGDSVGQNIMSIREHIFTKEITCQNFAHTPRSNVGVDHSKPGYLRPF